MARNFVLVNNAARMPSKAFYRIHCFPSAVLLFFSKRFRGKRFMPHGEFLRSFKDTTYNPIERLL
jgi:hypothetical protein